MCIVSIIGAILIVLIITWYLRTRREGFDIFGGLGDARKAIVACESECEREDPTKYLDKTKGSLYCDMKCYSVGNALRDRGLIQEVKTTVDTCYDICGDGSKGNWCRDWCFCLSEVRAKCEQECEYSTDSKEVCMNACVNATSPNCLSGSWGWK